MCGETFFWFSRGQKYSWSFQYTYVFHSIIIITSWLELTKHSDIDNNYYHFDSLKSEFYVHKLNDILQQ